MDSSGHARASRQEQHVTHAQQGLCPHLIQHGSGVDAAGDLKGNPRGNVRLDQTGDDIDRRTLRGQNQVDTGGTGLLGQSSNQLLDLLADHHHQISQLIDHHHDLRQGRQRRHLTGLGHLGMGQRIQQGLTLLQGLFYLGIEACQVASVEFAHQPIATFHLAHTPVQGIGREFHVGDHRREQVRNALVDRELQHLGIDQNQANLVGRAVIEQAQQHGIHANRLPRAGGTRHQQVGHLGQVDHSGCTGYVLAQCHGQGGTAVLEGRRANDLRKSNGLTSGIGQLQPHQALARNGLHHSNRGQRQCAGQVFG